MRNTKKAFTLVELIVVITILAILGTIAFISLQGYSSDARNSKRTSDLGSIISKMTIETTKGVNALSFVADVANRMTGQTIAWTGTIAGTDYDAWTVNYLALDMKESEFQDPAGPSYVIWVTTKAGGKYQVAATKETWGWAAVAFLKGNYVARNNDTPLVLVAPTIGDKTVTLNDPKDSNKVKTGDWVDIWTDERRIIKVSDSGMILTLDAVLTVATATIALIEDDADSLIGTLAPTTALGTPITDGDGNLPYAIN